METDRLNWRLAMEEKIANAEIEVEASAARVTSNITIEKREAAKKTGCNSGPSATSFY